VVLLWRRDRNTGNAALYYCVVFVLYVRGGGIEILTQPSRHGEI